MDFLTQLWIPILASAAAVWIASAIVWMAMPHHKADHSRLPDQEGFINALRAMNIPPGNYGIPHCTGKGSMNDPLVKECWEKGPLGYISLWKTPPNMGSNMIWTFITYLAVSALLAYVGWTAMGPNVAAGAAGLGGIGSVGDGEGGGSFMRIFRIMGSMGVAAYAFAHVPGNLWGGHYPRAIVLCVIDGVAYGLITGAIFAALWPSAA